jgi:hypothetical protein
VDTASRSDEYLLEEYKAASQLTLHIDELRNRLTSFFVALAGIAATGLAAANEFGSSRTEFIQTIALLGFAILSIVGTIVVRIVGRLRCVQLEVLHYHEQRPRVFS